MSLFERIFGKKKADTRGVGYRVVKTGPKGLAHEIERYDVEPSIEDVDWDAQESGNYVCQIIYADGKFGETVWRHTVAGGEPEEPEKEAKPREKRRSALVNEDRMKELVGDIGGLGEIAKSLREVGDAFHSAFSPSMMTADNGAVAGAPRTPSDQRKEFFADLREAINTLQEIKNFDNPMAQKSGFPAAVREKALNNLIEKHPTLSFGLLGMEDPIKGYLQDLKEIIGNARPAQGPPMIQPRQFGTPQTPIPPIPAPPPAPAPIFRPARQITPTPQPSPAPVAGPNPAPVVEQPPTPPAPPQPRTLSVKIATQEEINAEEKRVKDYAKSLKKGKEKKKVEA